MQPIILCFVAAAYNAWAPAWCASTVKPLWIRSVPSLLQASLCGPVNNSKVKHLLLTPSLQWAKIEREFSKEGWRWALARIRMDGEMRDGNDKSCFGSTSPLCKRGAFRPDTAINQTWTSRSNFITMAGREAHKHTLFLSHSIWVKLSWGLCLGHRGFCNIHLMGLFISFIFF